jgi:hypothetical protein
VYDRIEERASRFQSEIADEGRMFFHDENPTPVFHKAANHFTIFHGSGLTLVILIRCGLLTEGTRKTLPIALIISYKVISITG